MWEGSYRNELKERREKMLAAGGEKNIKKQHDKGKLTARERIDLLVDPGTFVEIAGFQISDVPMEGVKGREYPGDGVVTGYGLINGRQVFISSQDFTVMGGTISKGNSKKICQIIDLAIHHKAPYISINDSGGARLDEGIYAMDACSAILHANVMASGVIPQIAVILGPCAGVASYSPALMDFIIMQKDNGQMYLTGPNVVKTAIGQDISADELGGAAVHMEKSGLAHFCYENDSDCLAKVRELLDYLPQNFEERPYWKEYPVIDYSDRLESLVPDNSRKPYDMRSVILSIVDGGLFLEVQRDYAKNIIVGFMRIGGESVGVIANQPKEMAGSLDARASEKAARFIRFCDAFRIPLLAMVDVPGYMPGLEQETGGVIRRGAKLLYAFSEATVPKITLILRKAHGGAYLAMNSKSLGADYVFAWPIAQIAIMSAEGAVSILKRKELKEAEDPEKLREKFKEEYEKEYYNPYYSASIGMIDEVILPEETRTRILQAIAAFQNKEEVNPRKRHGNMPL
ncbi:MAG: acyl-CoA carboxylase subunit beta [Lachnospiraceae bacterium]|nr:acyl-CoA carboxylase subunit beta [Lachnospiraceae bacterium]